MAYSVNNTLAIRGSFGIFFGNWAASIQMPQNFQGSWPDLGTLGVSNLNMPGSALYVTGQNPFAVGQSLTGLQPAASPFTSNINYFVDPLVKNPYSEQWNIGIEQQMGQVILTTPETATPTSGANYNGASTAPVGGRTRFQWFNTSDFSTPFAGTLGNSGRNMLMDQT